MSLEMKCPYCAKGTSLAFKTRDIHRNTTPDEFRYYRCVACELIFLSPVPTDLALYYQTQYYGIPSTEEELSRRASRESHKLKVLKNFKQDGRLLDIGAGIGSFAYLAKGVGYDVEAWEMDTVCCRFMTEVGGLRVQQIVDPSHALDNASTYDVITLWQVIEHLSQPWKTLDAAIEHLAPGGILVVATPNPDSLQFRLFKDDWVHVDAPRHLHLIPMRLLEAWMEKPGIRKRILSAQFGDNTDHDIYGWRESLKNRHTQRPIRFSMFVLGGIISKLIAPFERRSDRGTTYLGVFQKMKDGEF